MEVLILRYMINHLNNWLFFQLAQIRIRRFVVLTLATNKSADFEHIVFYEVRPTHMQAHRCANHRHALCLRDFEIVVTLTSHDITDKHV